MGNWCKKWDIPNSKQNQDTQARMNALVEKYKITQRNRIKEKAVNHTATQQYKLIK